MTAGIVQAISIIIIITIIIYCYYCNVSNCLIVVLFEDKIQTIVVAFVKEMVKISTKPITQECQVYNHKSTPPFIARLSFKCVQ